MAADDQSAIPAKEVVRLLVKSSPTVLDDKALDEIFGDRYATTLSELAYAFDVEETTVRNTWRRGNDKIPGTTRRGGKCKFIWKECVKWFYRRKLAAAEGRGVDEFTKRKRAAETRAAEAEAELKERRARVASGDYILTAIPLSVFSSRISALRDGLMALVRKWEPALPKKYAKEITSDMSGDIHNLLTACSENTNTDFSAAVNQGRFRDV